jgi:hypothetical protein
MEISEYECQRNEHVLRRAEELRKILEVSGTSEAAVNTLILAQASSSVILQNAAKEGTCAAAHKAGTETLHVEGETQ